MSLIVLVFVLAAAIGSGQWLMALYEVAKYHRVEGCGLRSRDIPIHSVEFSGFWPDTLWAQVAPSEK